MTPTDNPWTGRFDPTISDSELKAKLGRQGRRLSNLSAHPVELAKSMLESALEEVVVVTSSVASTVRTLAANAALCAEQFYPNPQEFLRRIYSDEKSQSAIAPNCITGLSGVGKSVAIRCFRRLCFDVTVDVPGHGSLVLVPSRHLQPESGAGINQILAPLLNANSGARPRDVIRVVRAELARLGVALLTIDEFQFLTQGAGSSHLARTLMQLSRLGPPIVYAANYSMLHKLVKRPQEERQRLLSNVIVIQPDPVDSRDWNDLLSAYLDLAPEFRKLTVATCGSTVHFYTHGLKRLVVRLLVNAYAAMRERDGKYVDVDDLKEAYFSRQYASNREDVKKLMEIGKSESQPQHCRDLWCPLREIASTSNNPQAQVQLEQQRARAEALAAASMSAEERKAHTSVKRIEPSNSNQKKPGQVRRPAPTKESLLKASQSYAGKIAKDE